MNEDVASSGSNPADRQCGGTARWRVSRTYPTAVIVYAPTSACLVQRNIPLRRAINRCTGHGGRQHAQLQGSSNSKLRTTQAAVYPGRFCKAIVTDIMKYIRGNKSGAPQTTYLMNHQPTEIYYKCERCRLGRAAPPGMEHTLVPRECRVASSLPTPTSSTAQEPIRRAVVTPLEDMIREFKVDHARSMKSTSMQQRSTSSLRLR